MIGENLIILATDVDTGLQYEQKMHVLPAKLTKDWNVSDAFMKLIIIDIFRQ